jgi:preprotein translocase subunit SecF
MQLIKPGTTIDFVGMRKVGSAASLIAVLISVVLFFVRGPNWGIDFTGGTEIVIDFEEQVSIEEVRGTLAQMKLGGDEIQQAGSDEDAQFIIRIQDTTFGSDELRAEVESALRAKFGPQWISELSFDAQVGARMLVRYTAPQLSREQIQEALAGIDGAVAEESPDDLTVQIKLPGVTSKVQGLVEQAFAGKAFELSVESVGPKVGDELRVSGALAILATLALVLVYVAFRFDLAFAPGAVIALLHDVIVVLGVFTITGHEFNLSMVGAMLTIVGYSINDTIIIYDRIRENMRRYRRADLSRLINDSINETLTRTMATSLTTVMAVACFTFMGGPVIETFALAIILGVFFGTWSTIFVATPSIVLMEDLRPHLQRWFAPVLGAAGVSGPAPEAGALSTAGAGAAPGEVPTADAPAAALTASEQRRRERQERRRLADQQKEG